MTATKLPTILILSGLLLSFLGSGVSAATFAVDPASQTYGASCTQAITVYADASGESSNAADLEIDYNPTQISIIDSDTEAGGVQIETGNAYEAYFANEVNESTGTIKIAAGSFINNLSSRKVFAIVHFKALSGTTQSSLIINFSGPNATLDSNIADASTSTDLLTSVTNGLYTFSAAQDDQCSSDTTPPVIDFIKPVAFGQTTTPIQLKISDSGSGVDISNVIITINGSSYTSNSPEVTYTGTPAEYTFTINISDLPDNSTSVISVQAKDLAGNSINSQIPFNIPSSQNVCPVNNGGNSSNVCTNINLNDILTSPNNSTFLNNTIFNNTIVQQSINQIGVSSTGAALTVVVIALNLLPLLLFLNTPTLFLNIAGIYLGRKQARPWGIISDLYTNKPIAFASCRLYLADTKTLISQTVSDIDGRYGFSISPGQYRLEVSQSEYQKDTTDVEITANDLNYLQDIKLVSHELALSEYSFLNKLWRKVTQTLRTTFNALQPYLFAFGLVLAFIGAITSPHILNYIILIVYIVLVGFKIWRRVSKAPKFASVVDSQTNLRIPYVNIKIFDPQTENLVEALTTDQFGKFDFLGKSGDYLIYVNIRGYHFPSHKQTGLIKDARRGLLNVHLLNGNNKLKILVDPEGGSDNKENLSTPFN